MEMMDLVLKNARVVSHRYKEKCWWSSVEDTHNEAIVAQLHSLRSNYDPSRPAVRYLWQVALNAAGASVKRASAPVSSPESADNLVGLYRTQFVEAPETTDRRSIMGQALGALFSQETQHDLLEQKDFAERVRARVRLLLGDDALTFAIDLLTGEFRPADVAEEHGIPVAEVYLCVKRIKNALASDPELYRMWKE